MVEAQPATTPQQPPDSAGVLRSIALGCTPDTQHAGRVVDLAAAPEVKVRDGNRWTAYVAPDLVVALAAPEELPAGATVSLNVKVADVHASLAALVATGVEPAGGVVDGNHELRAAVWLSPGVALSLYQPR